MNAGFFGPQDACHWRKGSSLKPISILASCLKGHKEKPNMRITRQGLNSSLGSAQKP